MTSSGNDKKHTFPIIINGESVANIEFEGYEKYFKVLIKFPSGNYRVFWASWNELYERQDWAVRDLPENKKE